MKIERFVDYVLKPKQAPKGQKKVAWGLAISLGVASLGSAQLICFIFKKCFSKPHTPPTKISSSLSKKPSSSSVKVSSSSTITVPSVKNPSPSKQPSPPFTPTPSKKHSKCLSFDSQKVPISKFNLFHGTSDVGDGHLNKYFIYAGARYEDVFIRENQYPIRDQDIISQIDCEQILLEKDLFFPSFVHVGGKHWTLVFIDKTKRTVEYFDSKKNAGDYQLIQNQLKMIAETLSQLDPTNPPFQFIQKTKKTLQLDSYQCGAWVMYFLNKRLEDPDFDFNKLDVQVAQAMIAEFRLEAMQKIEKIDIVLEEMKLRKMHKFTQQLGNDFAKDKYQAYLEKMREGGDRHALEKINILRNWYKNQ